MHSRGEGDGLRGRERRPTTGAGAGAGAGAGLAATVAVAVAAPGRRRARNRANSVSRPRRRGGGDRGRRLPEMRLRSGGHAIEAVPPTAEQGPTAATIVVDKPAGDVRAYDPEAVSSGSIRDDGERREARAERPVHREGRQLEPGVSHTIRNSRGKA